MEVAMTTMSRNGQIVIPSNIRKALRIGSSDKFIVFGEGNTIVIKRLTDESLKKELLMLLDTFTFAFQGAGISKKDLEREIEANRKAKWDDGKGGGGHKRTDIGHGMKG